MTIADLQSGLGDSFGNIIGGGSGTVGGSGIGGGAHMGGTPIIAGPVLITQNVNSNSYNPNDIISYQLQCTIFSQETGLDLEQRIKNFFS